MCASNSKQNVTIYVLWFMRQSPGGTEKLGNLVDIDVYN